MSGDRTETWAGGSDPVPAAGDQLAAATRVGRLVVLEQVGEGGMGRVYGAYDPLLDRRVCLKFLKSPDSDPGRDRRHRLMTEARALARLSHPNILPIHDVGEFEDQVYLVTEFVDGWTLDHWIAENSPATADVVDALLAAGEGLAAAHAQDIVHRDLKPENVMMGRDGRVRVMDFGLASRTASTDAEGRPYGTPRYMAPEQRRGEAATPATDQYAWCLTLAACLGAEVRDGEIDDTELSRLPLEEWQKRALRRGLSGEASARFENMSALMSATRPRQRRMGRTGMLLGLVGLASVTGALFAITRASDPCPPTPAPTTAWNAAQRSAMRDAFAATGLPYATQAFDHLTPLVDRYLDDWSVQHQSACAATHVRNEQSADLLDRRMVCLDSRLHQLDALGRLFAKPDTAMVDASMNAMLGLPSLDACADRENLLSKDPLPSDSQKRQSILALQARLTESNASVLAGRYSQAETILTEVQPAIVAQEYLPLHARHQLLLGTVRIDTGDRGKGLSDLEEAVFEAQMVGDLEMATIAALERASTGMRGGDPRESIDRWMNRARLLSVRTDNTEALAKWAFQSGQYQALLLGDTESALKHLESSLRLHTEHFGEDSPETGKVMNIYAWTLAAAGRNDQALEYGRRSLDIIEQAYGVFHNTYLVAANNYASILKEAGQSEAALTLLAKAYPAGRENVGPEHPHTLMLQLTKGTVLMELERYEEALPVFREVRETVAGSHGVTHRLYGMAAAGEGISLRETGLLAESERIMQTALDVGGEQYPPRDRALLYFELARTLAQSPDNRSRIRELTSLALSDLADGDTTLRSEVAAFAEQWK
ncbi:MAG: serine/threonine protein kinase [Xanthomonadales bacterium]|nr:serine/threonine protein kinase [Xanthomonadales bacterium]